MLALDLRSRSALVAFMECKDLKLKVPPRSAMWDIVMKRAEQAMCPSFLAAYSCDCRQPALAGELLNVAFSYFAARQLTAEFGSYLARTGRWSQAQHLFADTKMRRYEWWSIAKDMGLGTIPRLETWPNPQPSPRSLSRGVLGTSDFCLAAMRLHSMKATSAGLERRSNANI